MRHYILNVIHYGLHSLHGALYCITYMMHYVL